MQDHTCIKGDLFVLLSAGEDGADGFLHHHVFGKLLLHPSAGSTSHFGTLFPAQQSHLLHPGIKAVCVLHRAQQTASALVHRLTAAVDVGGDDGTTRGSSNCK